MKTGGLKLTFSLRYLKVAIFSAVVFLSSAEIGYISNINPTFVAIQSSIRIILIIMLAIGILSKRSIILYRVMYIAAALTGVVFLSTLINGGNIVSFINKFAPMIVVCMILENYKDDIESILTILNVWKWFLIIVCFLDLISEIIFPYGMYSTRLYWQNWFLGYKTERLVYIFPMLFIYAYLTIKRKGKTGVVFYILIILSIVDCYLADAMSCLVSLVIFFVLYVFISIISKQNLKKSEWIIYHLMDYRVCLLVYGIILLLIVGVQYTQMTEIITSLLGRSSNFSGRSIIWGTVILQIKKNPVLGVGYMNASEYSSLINMAAATNAHNAVLTLLMHGGIIGLLLYITILIVSVSRKNKRYSKEEYLLVAGIYSILITGVTSSIMVISMFGLLCFWLMEHEKDNTSLYG